MDAQVGHWAHCPGSRQHVEADGAAGRLSRPPVLLASAAGRMPDHVPAPTRRMDEAYEAVVQRLGGLDQCKPKAVLQQLQVGLPGCLRNCPALPPRCMRRRPDGS